MDSFRLYSKYRVRPQPRADDGVTPKDDKQQPGVSPEAVQFTYTPKKQNMDRHFAAMAVYPEAPFYWYIFLLAISFFAGLIVVIKGGTTLPVWGYIVALLTGSKY